MRRHQADSASNSFTPRLRSPLPVLLSGGEERESHLGHSLYNEGNELPLEVQGHIERLAFEGEGHLVVFPVGKRE